MLLCMRTTMDLNDELFRQAKKRAVDDGIPVKAVVEAALRAYLGGSGLARKPYVFKWTPERGIDHPDIDWSDWASVKRFFRREDDKRMNRKLGIKKSGPRK